MKGCAAHPWSAAPWVRAWCWSSSRRGIGRDNVALDPGGFWTDREAAVFLASLRASIALVWRSRPVLPTVLGNPAGRSALLAQFSAHPPPSDRRDVAARRRVARCVAVAEAELGVVLRADQGRGGHLGGRGLASGPLHLGWDQTPKATLRRPLLTAVVAGAVAFAEFYGAALVAKRIPPLDAAVPRVCGTPSRGRRRWC